MPYMEDALRDILRHRGWPRERIEGTTRLRRALPSLAKALGVVYIDGTDMVDDDLRTSGTIFSRFAFYADHSHFSPLGNRRVAEAIHHALREMAVVP